MRLGLITGVLTCGLVWAQTPVATKPAAATGIFNWIHSSGDIDRGYAFYHEVFGIDLVNPVFGPIPGAPPPRTIRPRSEAISDPVIGNLTNTGNARFRNIFMGLPGAGFGLELSEFDDIESRSIRPNFWDPGATSLILEVRDIDAVFSALRKAGAAIVTLSGTPVTLSGKHAGARSILTRDPDGYLIQVTQATPEALERQPLAKVPGSIVVGAAIGLTVSDIAAERKFYRDILGFDVTGESGFRTDKSFLDLIGLKNGRLRLSTAYIPGTRVRVEFYQFKNVKGVPVRLRIQDPGAPQLQLRVRELDALMKRMKDAGYAFVSVGEKPIQRAFGRFVFVLDPNGVLVEFVHPALATTP